MALRGSLSDATVPDVIQFVHASQRSGVLAVKSASGEAWVEFDGGDVVFARSPSTRSLGVLLIDGGLLTLEQVADAVREQRSSDARIPLGRLLLSKALISAETLTEVVRKQILGAIEELSHWTEGEFAFDPTPVLATDEIRVDVEEVLPSIRLNTQFVLLESMRVMDERQRDRVSTPPPTPAAAPEPTDPFALAEPPPPTLRGFSPLPPQPSSAGRAAPARAVPAIAPPAPPASPLGRVQLRQEALPISGNAFVQSHPRVELTPAPPPPSPTGEYARPPDTAPPQPTQSFTPPAAIPAAGPGHALLDENPFLPVAERAHDSRTPPIVRALRSADGGKRGPTAPPALLVGFERGLSGPVVSALSDDGHVVLGHVPRREVEAQLIGERRWPTTVLIAWRIHSDPESGAGPVEEQAALLQRVVERHPGWCVVGLPTTFGTEVAARLYGAGVRAVMPAVRGLAGGGDGALDALVSIMNRLSRDAVRLGQVQMAELRAWVQAKHLTTEMHRELERAHIALELMRVAARSLERAALLFARGSTLVGLGGFGAALDGRPLADVVRNLKILVLPNSVAARCLGEQKAFLSPTGGLGLEALHAALGRPANDRAVVVPLVGPSRALGLIYGDNGGSTATIKGVPEIELAAAQAGVAYENLAVRESRTEKVP